jgi:hypothetical protein
MNGRPGPAMVLACFFVHAALWNQKEFDLWGPQCYWSLVIDRSLLYRALGKAPSLSDHTHGAVIFPVCLSRWLIHDRPTAACVTGSNFLWTT